MHGVQRYAHERGTADSEDFDRLDVGHPAEGGDLPLRGD